MHFPITQSSSLDGRLNCVVQKSLLSKLKGIRAAMLLFPKMLIIA